jgi:hypothetical protein
METPRNPRGGWMRFLPSRPQRETPGCTFLTRGVRSPRAISPLLKRWKSRERVIPKMVITPVRGTRGSAEACMQNQTGHDHAQVAMRSAGRRPGPPDADLARYDQEHCVTCLRLLDDADGADWSKWRGLSCMLIHHMNPSGRAAPGRAIWRVPNR